jgi:hypothetical protein
MITNTRKSADRIISFLAQSMKLTEDAPSNIVKINNFGLIKI